MFWLIVSCMPCRRSPSPVAGLVDSPIYPPSPTFESPLASFSPMAQFSPLGVRRADGGSLPGLPPTAGSAVRFYWFVNPYNVVSVRWGLLPRCGLDSNIGSPAADTAVSAVCIPAQKHSRPCIRKSE